MNVPLCNVTVILLFVFWHGGLFVFEVTYWHFKLLFFVLYLNNQMGFSYEKGIAFFAKIFISG